MCYIYEYFKSIPERHEDLHKEKGLLLGRFNIMKLSVFPKKTWIFIIITIRRWNIGGKVGVK